MPRKPRPIRPSRPGPSYRLAMLDRDFLMSDSMRGLRLQVEYTKTEEALQAWGVRSTIVVFGGARVREGGAGGHAAWYEEARRFGRIASERGGALREAEGARDNVIATGGGPGIMEAASRGAREAGAPSVGFNIRLPHEQVPNRYTTPELTFQFHYFAIRKFHLAMRANALVVFPGGFGTLDELFELLTLRQTGRMRPTPIVLVDAEYWRRLIHWEAMAEAGVIAPADLDLLHFVANGTEAWAVLEAAGVALEEVAAAPSLPSPEPE
ncbi:LOG family protein [Sabulicella glaciei]|uniref:Cytokinin riboside 5'-monophosphate phosphoribohydrolase n=1 Tax=Sabulicella glaciei TaxID=2984948 RepID=A0ABT3P1S7_9PROT|nr:TIGR00730 family Rossman fold protein [Roseococcus sp. MDT2-1-1]MCW8088363.1 TIGR00730 family Rossman fold protein [Roseococcus sp. MDT2-1-1]